MEKNLPRRRAGAAFPLRPPDQCGKMNQSSGKSAHPTLAAMAVPAAVTGYAGMTKILVPVDGSPASLRAVRLAAEHAKGSPAAGLVIVNVQNLVTAGLGAGSEMMPPEWIDEEEAKAAEDVLAKAAAVCRDAGIPCVMRSERGAVAATIDHVARAEHATHIVMGTRGLGGVRGLLLGSVATQLLHLTDVPVTLVK